MSLLDLFIVKVGDQSRWERYTFPFILAYARQHQYRLNVLTRAPFWCDDRSPSWLKTQPHIFINSLMVVSWDLDLIPLPGRTPPIHEHLKYSSLNMAKEGLTLRRARCLRKLGIPKQYNYRWNSGLVGIPKALAPSLVAFFNASDPNHTVGYEQESLNQWIWRDNVPIHTLDQKWNWIVGKRFSQATLEGTNYTLHFAGRVPARERRARHVWEHYNNPSTILDPSLNWDINLKERPPDFEQKREDGATLLTWGETPVSMDRTNTNNLIRPFLDRAINVPQH